jgi:uncharacterized protein (TIGR00106 family)
MPIAQLTVVPLGGATSSLSDTVAQVVRAIEKSGVKYQLTPMSTILEGPLPAIIKAVRAAHEAAFAAGAGRVSTTLTIDDRRDRPTSMEHKVKVVRAKMNKQ